MTDKNEMLTAYAKIIDRAAQERLDGTITREQHATITYGIDVCLTDMGATWADLETALVRLMAASAS